MLTWLWLLPLCLADNIHRIVLPHHTPQCIEPPYHIINDLSIPGCVILPSETAHFTITENGLFLRSRLCPPYESGVHLSLDCDGKTVEHELKLVFEREKHTRRRRRFSESLTFDQTVYEATTLEEAPVGEEILRVHARNPDGLPLLYSLSSASFEINQSTGAISALRRLDRESVERYTLLVRAYEPGRGRSASATVVITVEDVNDHTPTFEKSTYFSSVSESLPVGSTIVRVHAVDRDSGENARLRYSLEGEGPFTVDAATGAIQLTSLLDRESTSFYRLHVTATDHGAIQSGSTDHGADESRSSTALVEVTVDDSNDCVPQFEKSRYEVTVDEDLDHKARPTLLRIVATDCDEGDNARLRYNIVSGNVRNAFAIDYSTGDIRVIAGLSHQRWPRYELVVRARDAGLPRPLSNTTLVVVNVRDVNDHAPRFYAASVEHAVREDVPVGHAVVRVHAHDGDSGANADIAYSISPSTVPLPFTIDATQGWIHVTSLLDRESAAQYNFEVVASDAGEPPRKAQIPVKITVQDVDDNVPQFFGRLLNVSVREDIAFGSEVARLHAEDKDGGTVTYRIVGGDEEEHFLLLEEGGFGVIRTQKTLNYNQQAEYQLTVKAADDGGNFDTAVVHVRVLDVNSPPYFDQHPVSVSIREDEPVGATVAVMQAFDHDQGLNAKLSFRLEGSDDFVIDSSTGVISSASHLDRESTGKYELRITVLDAGDPTLSDTSYVEVLISDVNDNAPVFLQNNYSVVLSEAAAVDTQVLQVSATDADIGSNGAVLYSLANDSLPFYIDENSGIIRIESQLDRENQSSYDVVVLATDRGSPPLQGNVTLHIVIADENDNAPTFTQKHYHFYVAENAPIGSTMGKLMAVDPDEGKNAVVEYKIFGGAAMDYFTLSTTEEDGVQLLSLIHLDFEARLQPYHLLVQALSGDLASVAQVTIHILDQNDNSPILNDFKIVFNNYRDSFNGPALAGRIPAYDPDINDTLYYSIVSGNEGRLLHLEPNTGEVALSAHLNTNRPIHASMKMCVSDGLNTACARCMLEVRLITEDLLENSVTLRLAGATLESLLSPAQYGQIVYAIASSVPTSRENVAIFSILPADSEDARIVNVSLSVKRDKSDRWMSSQELEEVIYASQEVLSQLIGFHVLPPSSGLCVREPCRNYEKCSNALKFVNAAPFTVTDNFMFRPIHPGEHIRCSCPHGFAGLSNPYSCDTQVNLCYSNPCKHNGTCLPTEGGFVCRCPVGYTGKQCELPTSHCLPHLCQNHARCSPDHQHCTHCPLPAEWATPTCQLRARSFQEGQYLLLPTLRARFGFVIELSFTTTSSHGLLFYNGRRTEDTDDVLWLELVEGRLQAVLGLGAQTMVRLSLDGGVVHDGRWHSVKLEYREQELTLSLDQCPVELALQHGAQIGLRTCVVRGRVQQPQSCSVSSASCRRSLDLISPFYLGGLPSQQRSTGHTPQTRSYSGCVRDLHIQHGFVDLSSHLGNYGSTEGCRGLAGECDRRPCDHAESCTELLGGYQCQCRATYAGRNCSDAVNQPLRLTPDSNVSFMSAGEIRSSQPAELAVDFRTLAKNAAIVRMEFGDTTIELWLKDSRLAVQFGRQIYENLFDGFHLDDGSWHHAELQWKYTTVNVSLDFVYKKSLRLSSGAHEGVVRRVSSGKDFAGCLSGVRLGRQYLSVLKESNTKPGCAETNACRRDSCDARRSTCISVLGETTCRCKKGYFGSQCVPACAVNPCRNGGQCKFDLSHDLGYRCSCPLQFTGAHCELPRPTRCPTNWWGFPVCGPCNCDTERGFNAQCNKGTGECLCQAHHYQPPHSAHCVPCHCNPSGSLSAQCDSSGQCKCKGDAQGRQCERCANVYAEIDANNGSCIAHPGFCPSQLHTVAWPRTQFSATVSAPCPPGAIGFVTRHCIAAKSWLSPKFINCTSERFVGLAETLATVTGNGDLTFSAQQRLLLELSNATKQDVLYPRDLYIAHRLLLILLRTELESEGIESAYSMDRYFVENIVSSVGAILSQRHAHHWAEYSQSASPVATLLSTLHEYGESIASTYRQLYLKPLRALSEHEVFTVDTVALSVETLRLPKYDDIPLPRSDDLKTAERMVQVSVPLGTALHRPAVVFHAAFEEAGSLMPTLIDNAIAAVSAGPILLLSLFDSSNFAKPIDNLNSELTFARKINDPNGAIHCVHWRLTDSSGYWSRKGCRTVSVNSSHVVCACSHMSMFTVMESIGDHSFTITTDPWLAILTPCAATIAPLILVSTALLRAWLIRPLPHSDTLLLCTFFCLAAAIGIFPFATSLAVFPKFCTAVRALLHFTYTSAFAWLFVACLHLYRIMTDIRDLEFARPRWVLQIAVWTVCSVLSGVCAGLLPKNPLICWYFLHRAHAWAMLAPIALLLLPSVYLTTMCAVLTCSKDRDIVGVKARRSALTLLPLILLCAASLALALASLTFQCIWLHYAYVVCVFALALFVFLAFCVFDPKIITAVKTRSLKPPAKFSSPHYAAASDITAPSIKSKPTTLDRRMPSTPVSPLKDQANEELLRLYQQTPVRYDSGYGFSSSQHDSPPTSYAHYDDVDQHYPAITHPLLHEATTPRPDLIPSPDRQQQLISAFRQTTYYTADPHRNSGGTDSGYSAGSSIPHSPGGSSSLRHPRRPILSPAPTVLGTTDRCATLPSPYHRLALQPPELATFASPSRGGSRVGL